MNLLPMKQLIVIEQSERCSRLKMANRIFLLERTLRYSTTTKMVKDEPPFIGSVRPKWATSVHFIDVSLFRLD